MVLEYDSSKGYNVMMPKKLPFSEVLRRTIERSEKSRYRISKETGIDQAVLSHFVHGHSGLSINSIDLLVECLDLEIVPRQKRK